MFRQQSLISILILISFCLVLPTESKQEFGSFCNPLKPNSCETESLICYQQTCLCAPGYKLSKTPTTPNPNSNSSATSEMICKKFRCKSKEDCHDYDEFRSCSTETGECNICINDTSFDKTRQRCVSPLGQPCGPKSFNHFIHDDAKHPTIDENGEYDIIDGHSLIPNQTHIFFRWATKSKLVCRNGVWVCMPNHYPDDEWTHCKPEAEECKHDWECQTFSDRFRVCKWSHQHNQNRCQCDLHTFENPITLQCVYNTRMITSFILMPFFLLPMCLMIVIVAYVGHKLFRNITPSPSSPSSRNHRHRSHRSRTARSSNYLRNNPELQPDPTKSPSALSDYNDCPPSYEIVLREQQEFQQQNSMESSPSPSSSISIISNGKVQESNENGNGQESSLKPNSEEKNILLVELP